MSEKYEYRGSREIKTYVYLRKNSEVCLEAGLSEEAGSTYQFMTSIMFSAFTLEAYLNHLGEKVIEYWSEIDQIRTINKLKVLYSELDINFDNSCRPIQTVGYIFKFRNFMAHARTENISETVLVNNPDPKPGEEFIEADWEKFCNGKEAERALNDVEEIIKLLHKAAGLGESPFVSFGGGSWSISKPSA